MGWSLQRSLPHSPASQPQDASSPGSACNPGLSSAVEGLPPVRNVVSATVGRIDGLPIRQPAPTKIKTNSRGLPVSSNWSALGLAEKAALYDVLGEVGGASSSNMMDPPAFSIRRLLVLLSITILAYVVWIVAAFARHPIRYAAKPNTSNGIFHPAMRVDGWLFILFLLPPVSLLLSFVIRYTPIRHDDLERRQVVVFGRGAWRWWRPCAICALWMLGATFVIFATTCSIIWHIVKQGEQDAHL